MLQHSGSTGVTHEIAAQPRLVRGSFSHVVRRPEQEVKLHALFEGVPDGTKIELDFLCTTLDGMVDAKGVPGPEKTKDGRATFKWKVDFEGEVGPGFFATVQAMFSSPDFPNLAGMTQNFLAATRFGAIVNGIDKQFCPAVESMTTQYTVVDPYDYIRSGVFRVYANQADGKCFPDKKALVYQRLLTPAEMTPGRHKIEWQGFANRTKGEFAPAEKGGIRYVDPLYSPYVVQVQLLDRSCDDAEKWPDKDALPSLPSPLFFKDLGLKKGDNGYEKAPTGESPTHTGFEIVYGGVELSLGDFVPHEDEALKNEKRFHQYRLNKLGYFCGPVDGTIGSISKQGIAQFKRTHWETKADDTKPTGLVKDYEKPLQNVDLTKVTGTLDNATKQAILEEQDARTFLEIVDDALAPTGDLNRLPVHAGGVEEHARIVVDGDIAYQKSNPEFSNGQYQDGTVRPVIMKPQPGSVKKQTREKDWIPRPWLPVQARPRLLNKEGRLATAEESRYGAGATRILFRCLETVEDRSNLGFPTAPFTGLDGEIDEITTPAGGRTVTQLLVAKYPQQDKRRGFWTTGGGWNLGPIWSHPQNKPLRDKHGNSASGVTLDAGDKLYVPPFPDYIDYQKHRGTYREGTTDKLSRPEEYVKTQIEANKAAKTDVEGYKDLGWDNGLDKLGGKDNYGLRDSKGKISGIEPFRFGSKIYALKPFVPKEENDERLSRGKLISVSCLPGGPWQGRAGLFFVPSIIAGDSYRVEAEIDLKRRAPKKDHPNAKALLARYQDGADPVLRARTGEMTVWRRAHVAEYIYVKQRGAGGEAAGANAVRALSWAGVQAKYRKAFIDLQLPASPNGRAMTNAEYRDILKKLHPSWSDPDIAAINLDREELWPSRKLSRNQMPAESIDDYAAQMQRLAYNWSDRFRDASRPILRKKSRMGWLIVDIRRYHNVSVLYSKMTATTRASFTQADVQTWLDSGWRSISWEKAYLLIDQRDVNSAETLFAHEMGHGLFLYHYLYAGDTSPTMHHSDDKFCIMSYNGPGHRGKTDLEFCGKCVLRLRGWHEQKLP